MKKVYLFAILFGASMAFTACGCKGENKECCEGENHECCEHKECCKEGENHECCKHAAEAAEGEITIEDAAALIEEAVELAK